MKKFNKGYTYLVKVSSIWYIVQQNGQRSWEAVVFSHHIDTIAPQAPKYLHGNGITLVDTIKDYDSDAVFVSCGGNIDMRKKMFRILQSGKIEGWEEL